MFEEVARLRNEADANDLAHRLADAGLCADSNVAETTIGGHYRWAVRLSGFADCKAVHFFVRGFLGGTGDYGVCVIKEHR